MVRPVDALTAGVSLRRLVQGFMLTLQTEGKSPRTIEYYEGNLRRFVWYAELVGWPSDAAELTEWHIREFLVYVASEGQRWGRSGNGSESSARRASPHTVWHYFRVLRVFFNWAVRERILKEPPLTNIRLKPPRPHVVEPYTDKQILAMLAICDRDYQHGARFLGSRNRAIVLMFLDTGLRLSELVGIRLQDIDVDRGLIKVVGKGAKGRVVRVGATAQKALWRYMMHRPDNGRPELWLTEEGRPLQRSGVQVMLKRLKRRAGLGLVKGSVHKFRHTFSLGFLRQDRNPFNLQYLLGHSTLEMTRRYVSTLGMEDALEAHVKASPADLLILK